MAECRHWAAILHYTKVAAAFEMKCLVSAILSNTGRRRLCR